MAINRRKFLALLGLGVAATTVKLPEAKASPVKSPSFKRCGGHKVLFDKGWKNGSWGAVMITDTQNINKRWVARCAGDCDCFAREAFKAEPNAVEIIIDLGDGVVVKYVRKKVRGHQSYQPYDFDIFTGFQNVWYRFNWWGDCSNFDMKG